MRRTCQILANVIIFTCGNLAGAYHKHLMDLALKQTYQDTCNCIKSPIKLEFEKHQQVRTHTKINTWCHFLSSDCWGCMWHLLLCILLLNKKNVPTQDWKHFLALEMAASVLFFVPWHFVQTVVAPRGRSLTFERHNEAAICGFEWNVSTTIGWFALKFHAGLHAPPRQNYNSINDPWPLI